MATSSVSALLLFSIMLILSFCCPSFSSQPLAAYAKKVTVSVYYESLSLDSAEFVVNSLSKIYDNGLSEIVDLSLVPFGNAVLLKNGTIICQNGKIECQLNTIEACLFNFMPPQEQYKFINCVSILVSEGNPQRWSSCLDDKKDVYGQLIYDSDKNGLARKLQLRYANQTAALNPPLEFVPWVTVNEVPLRRDIGNIMRHICKAYTGFYVVCQNIIGTLK
ncbi:hypothetical protein MKW98_001563 [Papaver atlanticum]|uniref:Gamma interferon inducible lysosomal thiol reductase GILT n=1 Tax=Papaver atlanticum TaxID=357466 RepID=A0AAD4S8W7_9MAGN|nr:hypothetical protein MKW98_001563 [Papaver atlanticum]